MAVSDGYQITQSPSYAFTTQVSQPLVSSHLAQNSGHGYDEQVGNYTTSATDAKVATVGPALAVERAYNSLDVRTTGAFGAGWSSLADEKAVMDDDGSQNVVITDSQGKQYRYGYSSSGYTPPLGTYATLTAASRGGYSLLDTDGTTYTFTTGGGTNTWLLTKITSHAGLSETFTYNSAHQLTQIENSASQRSLFFTWSTPSGAAHAHVATVTTDDATSGSASSAVLWTYGYNADQLTSVCPPSESASATASSSCYGYTYTSGSDYPAAALDADPYSYWRLNDASGATKAASSVLANEQTDAGLYSNVTLGSAGGPLAGSTATAATFNGSSSDVKLPGSLVTASSDQAVSLWFNTTGSGVLFSYQASSVGSSTTSGNYTPALYVGSDGKLKGEFWYAGGAAPISTSGTVNDGKWHHVVLSAAGTSQSLYLDGALVGSASGQVELYQNAGGQYEYLGAGFWGGDWPDEPHTSASNNTGYVDFFNGSISDVSFYTHPLTATQVTALRTAGTTAAAYLTKATRPTGGVDAQVSYDTAASRLTSVTDAAGGTYALGTPTVAGSNAVFASSVLGDGPTGYWRLGDESGATYAADEVNDGNGTYNDVTLGGTGPFSANDTTAPTAATFNGTDSYLQLPSDANVTTGPNTVAMWFKTSTAGGTLWGQEDDPVTSNPTSGNYTPSLYVGTDGKLHGEFWVNNIPSEMTSTSVVDDGKWHYVVLAASTNAQALYVDGSQQASVSATLVAGPTAYTYIGAGACAGSWAKCESNSAGYFNGSIAEVQFYRSQLTSTQIAAQWSAYQSSTGSVATETVNVTDPNSKTLSSTYDLTDGGRLLSTTDGTGATTSYGYDTNGFVHTVTDANGDVTTTGHDARGNAVSQTTCQSQSTPVCSTSYSTYYLNSSSNTDPRNDELLTSSDGRSSSSTDTTYQTSYSYDANGNLLTKTTPAVSGYISGLKTTDTYTTSSTAGYVAGTTVPAGLLASSTTPGGAVTSYTYYANGDLAQVVSPLGAKTLYTYDQLGRVLTKQVISDTYPSGLTTSFTYDPQGRVLIETDPGVTNHVTGTVHTRQTTTTYDADGNTLTTTVADTTGGDASRTTTKTYNADGELATTTDPAGNTTSYTYDAYGNLTGKTQPGGQQYTYTYDADGRLLTTTLANYTGSTATPGTPAAQLLETRTYFADGRLNTVTNAIGVTKTYAYYDNGLTKQITDTGSSGTTYTDEQDSYDAAGNLTSQVTKNGTLTTTRTVDAIGRPVTTTVDPSGVSRDTTLTYDADSHVLTSSESDAAGDQQQQWTYIYDAAGDKLSASEYAGQVNVSGVWKNVNLVTKWTYDQRGLAVSMTDPNGNVYAYTNDEAGSRAVTTAPSITTTASTGSTATVAPTTMAGYDTFGEPTQSEDALGNITSTAYDKDGRKTGTTLPSYTPPGSSTTLSATTAWAYDASGNLTTQTDALGNQTTYAYDQLGDQVSKTNPAIAVNGTATQGTYTYTYNLAGGQLTETSPYGSVTHHVYDDLGRATQDYHYVYLSPTASTTTKLQTTTTYNTAGYPASVASVTGVTTSYTYDALGQTLTAADTTGDTSKYTYDVRGDTIKTILPDGSIEVATYDAAGRKTATADENSSGATLRSTSTAYDADSNPTSTTNALGYTETYTYDALGDLTKQVEPVSSSTSITTSYGYDAAGAKTAYTDGNGNTTYYTYNPWGLQESEVEPATAAYTAAADRTTTWAYDADGRLATDADAATGTTLTYDYNQLSQPTSVTYGTSGDVRSFTYDALHHLASDTLATPGGSTVASIAYTTNAGDELTGKTTTGFTGAATNTYAYDQAGRLTSWNNGTTTTGYTYDADGNRLTAGPTTYTYDARDELTSDSANTYAYTARGTLASKTNSSTAAITTYTFDAYDQQATAGTTAYTYDALGRATQAGTATLTYSGEDNLVASDGTATYSRDNTGAVTGEAPTGGTAVLAFTDQHTDVVGQFTATGTSLTGSASYDPYGNPTTTPTLTGSLGYQSEYTDPTTGAVNMHARWYTPGTGTFTTADTVSNSPVGASVNANRYTYANDAPLTATDPSGHCLEDLCIGEGALAIDACIELCGDAADGLGTLAEDGWDAVFGDSSEADTVAADSAETDAALTQSEDDLAAEEANAAQENDQALEELQADAENEQALEELSQEAADSGGGAGSYGGDSYGGSSSYDEEVAAQERAAEERAAAERAAAEQRARILARARQLTAKIGRSALKLRPLSGAGSPAAELNASFARSFAQRIVVSAVHGAVDSLGQQATTCALQGGSNCSASAFGEAALGGAVTGGVSEAGSALVGKLISSARGLISDSQEGSSLAAEAEQEAAGCPVRSVGSILHSFTGSTPVLMADGSTKPISKIKPGDKITDSEPGRSGTQTHTVQHVIVTRTDHDFVQLTITAQPHIKTANSTTSSLTTTYHHAFYDLTRNTFVEAKDLHPGDLLQTPAGTARVTILHLFHTTTTTYDLTIDYLHTYYVLAGSTPILVHNANFPEYCGPITKNTHFANVDVFDSEGNQIDSYSLRSGATTPEEASLGTGRARQAVHTENRAARAAGGAPMIGDHEIPDDPFWGASPVPEGGRVQITGTKPPCGNCQGQMKLSSEDTGATFEYRWPSVDGGMNVWSSDDY